MGHAWIQSQVCVALCLGHRPKDASKVTSMLLVELPVGPLCARLHSTPVLTQSTSFVPPVVLGCQASHLMKHLLCASYSWAVGEKKYWLPQRCDPIRVHVLCPIGR